MKNRKVHIEKLIEVMSDKEFWGLINEDSVTDKLIEYGYDYIDEENYKKAFKIFIFLTRLYSQNTKIQDIDIDILNGLGLSLSGLSRFKVSKTIFEKILKHRISVFLPEHKCIYYKNFISALKTCGILNHLILESSIVLLACSLVRRLL